MHVHIDGDGPVSYTHLVAVFLLPVLAHPLCRIGAGIVMALCAFGEEVRPWRLTALFWLLSGGLAGLLLALGLLSGAPYGLVSRVSYADISWPVLLGGAAVFYGLLHLLFRQTCLLYTSPLRLSQFFVIQRSRKRICSSVWNQCSPPGMTVSSAPIPSAKADMVSSEVKLSRSPYRIRVGTRHETGCSRT